MKVYVCDACSMAIPDPHDVKMKEFCLAIDPEDRSPWMFTRKVKVHLCDRCYRGLRSLVK